MFVDNFSISTNTLFFTHICFLNPWKWDFFYKKKQFVLIFLCPDKERLDGQFPPLVQPIRGEVSLNGPGIKQQFYKKSALTFQYCLWFESDQEEEIRLIDSAQRVMCGLVEDVGGLVWGFGLIKEMVDLGVRAD